MRLCDVGGDGDDLVIGDTADIDALESSAWGSATVTPIFNIIDEAAPAFHVEMPSIPACFDPLPKNAEAMFTTGHGVSIHRTPSCMEWYTCSNTWSDEHPSISTAYTQEQILDWGARCCSSVDGLKHAFVATIEPCLKDSIGSAQPPPACFSTVGADFQANFANVVRSWETLPAAGALSVFSIGSGNNRARGMKLVTETKRLGAHTQLTCPHTSAEQAPSRIRADADASTIRAWAALCCKSRLRDQVTTVIESLSAHNASPVGPTPEDSRSVPCQFSKPGLLSVASRKCLRRPSSILKQQADDAHTVTLEYESARLSHTHDSRWPRIECAVNSAHHVSPFLSTHQLLKWNDQCCSSSPDTAHVIFAAKDCIDTSVHERGEAGAATNASQSTMYSRDASELVDTGKHSCQECSLEFGCHDQSSCTRSVNALDMQHAVHGTRLFVPTQYLPYAYHNTEGFAAEMHQHLTSVMSEQRQSVLRDVGANTFVKMNDPAETKEQVFMAFVPALNYQSQQLPGNDNITGGSGYNTVVGDTVTVAAHVLIPESDTAASEIMDFAVETISKNLLRFSVLGLDAYTYETQVVGENHLPQLLRFGNDRFVGSTGTDVVVGDSLFVVTPIDPRTMPGFDMHTGMLPHIQNVLELATNLDVALYEMQSALLVALLDSEDSVDVSSNVEASIEAGNDIFKSSAGNSNSVIIGDHLAVTVPRSSTVRPVVNVAGCSGAQASHDVYIEQAMPQSRRAAENMLRSHVMQHLQPVSESLGASVNRIPDIISETVFGNDRVYVADETAVVTGNMGLMLSRTASGVCNVQSPALRVLTGDKVVAKRTTRFSDARVSRLGLYSCRGTTCIGEYEGAVPTSFSLSDTVIVNGSNNAIIATDYGLALEEPAQSQDALRHCAPLSDHIHGNNNLGKRRGLASITVNDLANNILLPDNDAAIFVCNGTVSDSTDPRCSGNTRKKGLADFCTYMPRPMPMFVCTIITLRRSSVWGLPRSLLV